MQLSQHVSKDKVWLGIELNIVHSSLLHFVSMISLMILTAFWSTLIANAIKVFLFNILRAECIGILAKC
jgi:hypothetical protein